VGSFKRIVCAIVLLCLSGSQSRAERGKWNIEVNVGAAALATDTAAPGVKRFGLDLGLKADYPLPVFPMLAPQVGYRFDFLPGKSGVQSVLAGVRFRPLSDESGYPANLWPSGAGKGSILGALCVDASVGYTYAPTVSGKKNWFTYGFGLGYQLSVVSPLQMGLYVRYGQVVFPHAKDPIFVTFGLSVAFTYPKRVVRRRSTAKPRLVAEVMAEPNLVGKPGDRDGDSVADASDLCPITAPSVAVDEKGCTVLHGKLAPADTHFEVGSDRLSGRALLAIRRLADVLKIYPKIWVMVIAHAADQEAADLGMRRAKKVAAALVRFGVGASRVRSMAEPPGYPPPGQTPPPWWTRRVAFRFRLAAP